MLTFSFPNLYIFSFYLHYFYSSSLLFSYFPCFSIALLPFFFLFSFIFNFSFFSFFLSYYSSFTFISFFFRSILIEGFDLIWFDFNRRLKHNRNVFKHSNSCLKLQLDLATFSLCNSVTSRRYFTNITSVDFPVHHKM